MGKTNTKQNQTNKKQKQNKTTTKKKQNKTTKQNKSRNNKTKQKQTGLREFIRCKFLWNFVPGCTILRENQSHLTIWQG